MKLVFIVFLCVLVSFSFFLFVENFKVIVVFFLLVFSRFKIKVIIIWVEFDFVFR